MDKKLISVVVPCYNEEEVLPLFYDEIVRVSGEMMNAHPQLSFEFLFINDGSKDKTLLFYGILPKKTAVSATFHFHGTSARSLHSMQDWKTQRATML